MYIHVLWILVSNYLYFYGYPFGYPWISMDIHAMTWNMDSRSRDKSFEKKRTFRSPGRNLKIIQSIVLKPRNGKVSGETHSYFPLLGHG